jgi:hypothetical protein
MKLTRAQLNDPQYHRAPLWFVFPDYADRPRTLAAIVHAEAGSLTIWGFSIWKRAGAYRTIGAHFDTYVANAKEWSCYTTREEMLAHPGVIVDGTFPTENWLATHVKLGAIRVIKPATPGTLTPEQYVEAARSAGLLPELCVLAEYDPDVGRADEHWQPRYMAFARALLNTGGHRAV